MDIQPPKTLPLTGSGPGASLFGAGPGGDCNPWVYAIAGAVAFYALPPLLSGMIEGTRDALREHKEGR
jgi:hypothetical protein